MDQSIYMVFEYKCFRLLYNKFIFILSVNGIPIKEIFINPEEVKKSIVADFTEFNEDLVNLAFNGSIKTDHVS